MHIWAAAWQNQQNDLCAQRWLRSAWASAQSDQSLRCLHEEILGPYLSIERTVKKNQIRLGGCPGWSESSLGAHVILLVLSCGGSFLIVFAVAVWSHARRYEPRHDKTNKVTMRPAKAQISLGIHPVWSVFAVRMKKPCVLSYPLSAQRRLWSDWADWADAQADLSLRWAHSHFVDFVMSRLNSKFCSWLVMFNSRFSPT